MSINYTEKTIIIESKYGDLEISAPDKDGDLEFSISVGWDSGANTYITKDDAQALILWLQKVLDVRE